MTSDLHNENRDEIPERARALLSEIYAAPSDPGYWEQLEQRILARVRREGRIAWWSHFPDLVRTGLVAAAAALLLAGFIWYQDRRSAQRMAEERLLQPLIDEVPVLVETMADAPERTRDATLRYVISR
ncbi:MAG: hypothetical protein AB1762_16235 [Gemmatimonadota bacterium]